MQIHVHTAGTRPARTLAATARRRLAYALDRFDHRVRSVRLRLTPEGPLDRRGTPHRCIIELTTRGARPHVVARAVADSAAAALRTAIRRCVTHLTRSMERQADRDRQTRRGGRGR